MNVMRVVLLAAILFVACNRERGASRAEAALEPNWWEPACGKRMVGQVGGADVAPRLIHRVEPAWPVSLRDRGILIVAALVTETGTVCDARVLRGVTPEVNDAAVRAVKQWRFEPATKLGKPVAVVFHLTIVFGPTADATMRPQWRTRPTSV